MNGTASDLAFALGLILQTARDTSRAFVPPLDGRIVTSGALSTRSLSAPALQERYIWRLFPLGRWAKGSARKYRTPAGTHHLEVDVLEPLYVQHALAHLDTVHRESEIAKASAKDLRDTLTIDPAHFGSYKEFLQTMIRPFYSTTRVVVFENVDAVRGQKGWSLRSEFQDIELCSGAGEEDAHGKIGTCQIMCAKAAAAGERLE